MEMTDTSAPCSLAIQEVLERALSDRVYDNMLSLGIRHARIIIIPVLRSCKLPEQSGTAIGLLVARHPKYYSHLGRWYQRACRW